jgi:hypothetical protein
MMSLDDLSERVYDRRSKAYFDEALRAYRADSCRSANVLAWTAIVCDLYFKLIELRDVHQDPVAASLLTEVQTKQSTAQNKSEWETFLVEEVGKRFSFFETGEKEAMLRLRDIRHFCAHPTLKTSTLELYQPSREETAAGLRNALLCVLVKSPLMSTKVVESLVTDLAAVKASLPDQEKCETYLMGKWLRNMPESTLREVYRAIWKFCFRTRNPDTDENRQINSFALWVITKNNRGIACDWLRADQAHYANINSDESCLEWLDWLLRNEPDLWPLLRDDAQELLNSYAAQSFSRCALAWYRLPTLEEHFDYLFTLCQPSDPSCEDWRPPSFERQAWDALVGKARECGLIGHCCQLGSLVLGSSQSYDQADERAFLVSSIIDDFKEAELEFLLEQIESNSQARDRWRAKQLKTAITKRAQEVGYAIPAAKFRAFLAS